MDDTTDTPGVSTDDSGMSVVTVVGSQDKSLPWWPLLIVAGIVIYMGRDKPMRRRRNPDVGTKDVLLIGGIAAGAYLIYQLLGQVKKKVTDPAAGAIASGIVWWQKLIAGPPMSVPGDVVLPDGTDVGPLSSMQVKTDSSGNVYTLLGSDLYQIGRSDANGNWPVTLVLDPNFGVTGTGW